MSPITLYITLYIIIFAILSVSVVAFVVTSRYHQPGPRSAKKLSRIFGICEWRDQALNDPVRASEVLLNHDVGHHDGQTVDDTFCCSSIQHQVPVHLLDCNQVALLGEIRFLHFTKDDEFRIFQQAMDCHQGVFGLGFVANNEEGGGGILYDKISLVEIKDYNMMGGDFGIFLSVQVVGRAAIRDTHVKAVETPNDIPLDNHEDKQVLVAVCTELWNQRPPEHHVTLAKASEMGRVVESLLAEVCIAEKESCSFLGEDQDHDRWDRYQEAYLRTLESDTQGYYTYSASDSRPDGRMLRNVSMDKTSPLYTWKELNAISWAAFSTSVNLQQDSTYRLGALDNDYLTNRLLLATYWLSDVLQDVRQGAIN